MRSIVDLSLAVTQSGRALILTRTQDGESERTSDSVMLRRIRA